MEIGIGIIIGLGSLAVGKILHEMRKEAIPAKTKNWQNYGRNYSELLDDLEKSKTGCINDAVVVGEIKERNMLKSFNTKGPVAFFVTFENDETTKLGSTSINVRNVKSLNIDCIQSDDFIMTNSHSSARSNPITVVKTPQLIFSPSETDEEKAASVRKLLKRIDDKVEGKQSQFFYVLMYGKTLHAIGKARLEGRRIIFTPDDAGSSIESFVFWKRSAWNYIIGALAIGGIALIVTSIGLFIYRKCKRNNQEPEPANDVGDDG